MSDLHLMELEYEVQQLEQTVASLKEFGRYTDAQELLMELFEKKQELFRMRMGVKQ